MRRRIVLGIGLAILAAPAASKDSYVYGPAPDWSRYKALGEAAVRAKLPHPDHWTIEWPNGYIPAGWQHKGRYLGYLTCGVLRATSEGDGRYPVVNFAAVIDHDQVQTIDISTHERNSLVNVICDEFVRRGRLPPAKLMEAPQDLVVANLGLTIRAMPEGAYVVAAAAGSPAQHAGLAPGIVITSANGIKLAGLGSAMAKVLDGDAPSLTLETATGAQLEVRRAL